MKRAFKNEFLVVGLIAVLLAAVSVLAVIASRHAPDVPAYTGVSPYVPKMPVPVPPEPTARPTP